MKTYSPSILFPKGADRKKLIPKTDFMSGDVENQFHSEKNTELNRFTMLPSMTLAFKIGQAIANSQTKDFNIFRGELSGSQFYLGCFEGGSKNKYEYFFMDFNTNIFITTNMYSHMLFKLLIAYGRLNETSENGELNKMFRQIDFNQEDGIIGADQKKQFYITSDNLYFLSKETFLGKPFGDDASVDDFKDYIDYIKEDVTAFVQHDYDETISVAAKYLGIEKNNISVMRPKVIPKPKTMQEKLNELKNRYFDGIQTFTKEEIAKMPLLLRTEYDLAQEAFNRNKHFFGLEEWQLVDAIATGDVRSISLTGDAGVGKTTTCRSIAGALGMPFVLVGGSENIEETDLLGTRNVDAVDGVSVTTWTDGPITMAIRYGAFLLFDEVNAADPGILMKLNTILDGSKSLILSTAEKVTVHPNFVYSEAMNVGSAYAGTNQMNQSHFDRMDEMFKLAPKPPKEEAAIISANTGYKRLDILEKMALIKKEIINLIKDEGDASEQICSIRRLIAWTKKAKRTGEFIESSLNTVIAHLTVYDDSFDCLTKEAVLESSGIAATIMEKIIKIFENEEY